MFPTFFSRPRWPMYGSLMLLFSLVLGACTPSSTPTEAAPPSAASPVSPLSPPEAGTRAVQAVEIQAEVWLEEESAATRLPVQEGDFLPLHGVLETGVDSRARLDVLPDGTIIRLGAETRLQLAQLAPEEPTSRFQLWFGRVWVILNGGQLEVETSSGLASVRGSMLGVRFSPDSGELRVTCLEGHCALGNEQGQVELVAGQAATIRAAGEPPSPPGDILPEEQQEWQDEAPEAAPFLAPPPSSPPPPAGGGAVSPSPLLLTIYNGCADGQTPPQGVGVWTITLTDASGSANTYTLAPEETVEIHLPPGRYQVEALFPDGSADVTSLDSSQTPLSLDLCTPPPGEAAPGTGGLPPTPGLITSTTPSTYTLTNTCDETWHWVFSGPTTIQVDVPPGATVSGTLEPVGTYTAEDWLDSAPSHNYTADIPPGGNLTVSAGCP